MIENIKEYVSIYATLDEPIPYKELFIYPIKIKNVFKFLSSVDVLTIEKNKIADIQIIQMTYLQFLLELILSDKIWRDKIFNIFILCLSPIESELSLEFPKNEFLTTSESDNSNLFFFNGWNIKFQVLENNQVYLYINDIKIDSKEFDEIRKIIMFQNVDEYDDVEMSDDFRKVIEDYYKIKNKGIKSLTIEDKIDTIMSQTSYTKEQIKEMTYRSFDRIFEKVVGHTEYIIGKIAEMQGCKKDETEHWVYKKDKNKYEDALATNGIFNK